MTKAKNIETELRVLGDPAWALKSRRFFKTGQGEYSADDEFIGISMPTLRAEVSQRYPLALSTTRLLLRSTAHEIRLFALLMYERDDNQERWVDAYLENLNYVNNWDLVDCSAYKILGPHLLDKDKSLLFELATSPSLWRRRVAMITTLHFIKHGHVQTTIDLLDHLLDDQEDLIHKACGWMLREIGQVNPVEFRQYLNSNYREMPRTMLRYAIEKLSKEERRDYREGRVAAS